MVDLIKYPLVLICVIGLCNMVKAQDSEAKEDLVITISTFEGLMSHSDTVYTIFKVNDKSNLDICIELENFNEQIGFIKCKFKNDFCLTSVFKETLKFDNCEFYGKVDFSNSVYHKNLEFKRTYFTSSPDFSNSVLPDTLILSDVKIKSTESMDFSQSKLDIPAKKTILKLDFINYSSLIIPYHLFDINFESSLANIEGREGKHQERIRIYESLILSSIKAKLVESAAGWDIEYKKYMYDHRESVLADIFNGINKYWWNYGYDKGRVLWVWTPIFYLIFLLINFIFIERIATAYFDEDMNKAIGKRKGGKTEKLEVIIRQSRLLYSLVFTAAIYFNLRMSFKNMNFNRPLALTYLFLVYSIGTFHVVFGIFGYLLKV